MNNEVDFTIISAPAAISFTCPHCESDERIPWDKLYPPSYWGDYWGDIVCPSCEKTIQLGECEYD